MNTLEQTVLFLPVLWLAAAYGHPAWAGLLGLIWLIGRTWYIFSYLNNPVRRGPPFGLAMLAWLLLFVLAAWGVGRLLLSPACGYTRYSKCIRNRGNFPGICFLMPLCPRRSEERG